MGGGFVCKLDLPYGGLNYRVLCLNTNQIDFDYRQVYFGKRLNYGLILKSNSSDARGDYIRSFKQTK